MNMFAADTEGIAAAVDAIRAGQVILYPTETVYGIGADPFNPDAIDRVFVCKGRPRELPLILIASDMEQVESVVSSLSPAALRYASDFWPGPLSLLLPKSARIPGIVTAGRSKLCIRIPSHEIARRICEGVGHPIVSTSANASGESPARSVGEVAHLDIAVALDGGKLPEAAPSTVFDPDSETIVREGAVSREMLARVAAD